MKPIARFVVPRAVGNALLTALLVALLAVQPAQAAVGLIYFRATAQGSTILIEWGTASELDNAGFYVNRSEIEAGPYARICDLPPCELIPSQGDFGAEYSFVDTHALPGVVYYYKLETISRTGNSEFHGPVSAAIPTPTPTSTPTPSPTVTGTIVQTATATPTASATATATTSSAAPTNTLTPVTPSATLPTRTPTPVPTIRPTNTATNFPVVTFTRPPTNTPITPSITPTPSSTPTPEPTATLVPLPSITFVFPFYTLTPTVTPTFTTTPLPPPSATPTLNAPAVPLKMSFLGVIVALLWVLLGVLMYLILRRNS